MKSYFKLILIFILLFAGINMASAAGEVPHRMIYVNEWGGTFDSTTKIDKVISDAVYIKADAIAIQIGSEYFEAARDPNKISWDKRAQPNYHGLPMLEYFINRAHANNIQVHAWSGVGIVSGTKRAEYKLFGPSANYPYNIISQTGTKIGKFSPTNLYYRLDISFKGLQDYEIGLFTWVAKHYPTLDGLHIEEPVLMQYSYSTAVRDKVKIKYGYDPRFPGGRTRIQIQKDITDVQRDSWNAFFTKLRSSINANKANNNFELSANSWIYKYNPGTSAGFDPQYMAKNHLLDWYSLQAISVTMDFFEGKVKAVTNSITEIPVAAVVYPYYHSPTGDLPNPLFFDLVKNGCTFGTDGVAVFAWHHIRDGQTLDGKNMLNTLRNTYTSSCGNTPATSLTITSPNGGENWRRTTNHILSWSSAGSPGTYVKIELLKAGVVTRVIASSTPNDGSYSWTIPSTQALGIDHKIRVTSTTNSVYTDNSNNNFIISPAASLTVTSPNGGVNWRRTTTHVLSWSSAGSPGANVKIELLKNGLLNRVITSSTLNDGSYSWTIPSTQALGTDYKIRVTSTTNSAYTDKSNSNFMISS